MKITVVYYGIGLKTVESMNQNGGYIMKRDELVRAANNLVSYSAMNRCSLAETWDNHLPEKLKFDFTFEEVREHVEEVSRLGVILSNDLLGRPRFQSDCPACGFANILSEDETKETVHCQKCYEQYDFTSSGPARPDSVH